ncbi:hypothetical protein C4571_01905 [Candidatus Parcubacteria bacterium]|nr:MAG: hypothetical protein C4571_01905 [Candidatus Parcubacteria bacterium]
MNRVDFTRAISTLLFEMEAEGERPILDYVKRPAEEQRRLYDAGLSKCDGKVKVSKHQPGKAADIYFATEDGKRLEDPQKGWEYWHERWERLGGRPMIEWDKGHFEV